MGLLHQPGTTAKNLTPLNCKIHSSQVPLIWPLQNLGGKWIPWLFGPFMMMKAQRTITRLQLCGVFQGLKELFWFSTLNFTVCSESLLLSAGNRFLQRNILKPTVHWTKLQYWQLTNTEASEHSGGADISCGVGGDLNIDKRRENIQKHDCKQMKMLHISTFQVSGYVIFSRWNYSAEVQDIVVWETPLLRWETMNIMI